MTATLVSLALVFAPQQTVAPAPPSVGVEGAGTAAVYLLSTAAPDTPRVWTDTALLLTVHGPPPVVQPVEKPARQTEPPAELSPRELVDLILGWPFHQIIACESGWNRWAVGPYGERGLTQVHPVHAKPGEAIPRLGYTFDDMFEVEPNLRVAAEIRRTQGLRAWTCYRGAA